ncbi:MAG: hypothetical protein EOO06_05460 [Chitinophagaceae bacterium]|nr:MAG: hypothetical protein EOO06_05460 [Chitinophagaceae bacterium]
MQEELKALNRTTIRKPKLEIKTHAAELKRLVSFGEGLKRRAEELERVQIPGRRSAGKKRRQN